jgi:putative SOS response-associated peptidase YedK
MCGRYTLAAGPPELVEAFDVPLPDFEMVPRYNVAPGQLAPIVAEDRQGRRAGLMTWGLIPGWRDEPGKPMINARCETVSERPSFRQAFERRRCLVPADGFYEWKRSDGHKVPFWIHPRRGGLISFAGIWERWARPGAEPRHTFAILTMDASPAVEPIHDRMPVVIGAADRSTWLDRGTEAGAAVEILRRSAQPDYECRPVSTRVNRPDEDDAGLIEPVGA